MLSMGHGFPAAVLFINSKHRHAAKQHTYAYSFASFQGFKFKTFGFVVVRLGPQIRLALPWQSRYDAGTRWVSGKSWKVINQMRLCQAIRRSRLCGWMGKCLEFGSRICPWKQRIRVLRCCFPPGGFRQYLRRHSQSRRGKRTFLTHCNCLELSETGVNC